MMSLCVLCASSSKGFLAERLLRSGLLHGDHAAVGSERGGRPGQVGSSNPIRRVHVFNGRLMIGHGSVVLSALCVSSDWVGSLPEWLLWKPGQWSCQSQLIQPIWTLRPRSEVTRFIMSPGHA